MLMWYYHNIIFTSGRGGCYVQRLSSSLPSVMSQAGGEKRLQIVWKLRNNEKIMRKDLSLKVEKLCFCTTGLKQKNTNLKFRWTSRQASSANFAPSSRWDEKYSRCSVNVKKLCWSEPCFFCANWLNVNILRRYLLSIARQRELIWTCCFRFLQTNSKTFI